MWLNSHLPAVGAGQSKVALTKLSYGMLDQKKIGSLSDSYYSFMGALTDVTGIIQESGPEVARRLKDEGVEVVLLTPT